MSDLSWLNSHTPCNRCVRFATTVASGHATLATKRTLLLTWAGLPPAGSHQLCLAHSLNHLVGSGEQRRRHGEAEHPRRLVIDDQFELARLLNRQVRGFGALEDTTGVGTGLTIGIRNIGCIAHQPTEIGKLTPRIYRGDPEARCQLNQLDASVGEQLFGADVEGVGPV